MRPHVLRRPVVTLAAGAALVLGATACSSDDKKSDDGKAASSAPAAPPSASAATSAPTAGSGAPSTATGGTGKPAGGTTPSAKPARTGTSAGSGTERTLEGAVKYLAPGKYTIDDQEFLLAADTKVTGGGAMCPGPGGMSSKDAKGYGNVPCTGEKFEATAKDAVQYAFIVKVTLDKNGIANTITEKIG
ncbi:MAG: hypothetical protein HOV66_06410 [Streptomycetaceae bacterium]|nr:hypothetical protein [Streptomycetaceae bacterium]